MVRCCLAVLGPNMYYVRPALSTPAPPSPLLRPRKDDRLLPSGKLYRNRKSRVWGLPVPRIEAGNPGTSGLCRTAALNDCREPNFELALAPWREHPVPHMNSIPSYYLTQHPAMWAGLHPRKIVFVYQGGFPPSPYPPIYWNRFPFNQITNIQVHKHNASATSL